MIYDKLSIDIVHYIFYIAYVGYFRYIHVFKILFTLLIFQNERHKICKVNREFLTFITSDNVITIIINIFISHYLFRALHHDLFIIRSTVFSIRYQIDLLQDVN